ncbi:MAG TPA: methylated-DNA--[protein]-cysteine S-methyltransferase [Flavobacteriaceae bacterium]|nr:methylated-DNA--[protein]-cysteine S-methyltransferase [Flavobacteriaceae bacterium]
MENQINISYFKNPFGELLLGSFNQQLCLADWRYRKMRTAIDQRIQNGLNATYIEETTEIIEETKLQFNQYFEGNRNEFNIPLLLVGTDFQKKVWNNLLQIPFGKTESYLGLSKKLAQEKAIRAVASANGANSISIIVPCHRIIGSKGDLVGYAGGLNTKMKLLTLENPTFNSQMKLF